MGCDRLRPETRKWRPRFRFDARPSRHRHRPVTAQPAGSFRTQPSARLARSRVRRPSATRRNRATGARPTPRRAVGGSGNRLSAVLRRTRDTNQQCHRTHAVALRVAPPGAERATWGPQGEAAGPGRTPGA